MTTTVLMTTYGDNRSGTVREVEPHQLPIVEEKPQPEPRPEFYRPAPLGDMYVWEIDDGATYWIAAKTIREALDVYWRALSDAGCDDPGRLTIDDVGAERAASVRIRDDYADEPDREVSAAMLAAKAHEPTLLGCSEW